MSDHIGNKPNFDGVFGLTINPVRLVYLMAAVWQLCRIRNAAPVRILEIGSWSGSSALTMAEAMELYGSGGRFTCVDAWKPHADLEINRDENTHAVSTAPAPSLNGWD